ncbi:hypothetical protein [Gluconobacter sp. OJB]|uniref:hypothetical protein n=1 Tax=Gluconobacter sp. OJB TaxID=3145196 RepID=UPI0031F8079B
MSFIQAINDIQNLTSEYQKVKKSGQNLESFINQATFPSIHYEIDGHQNMIQMNAYTPYDNFYNGVYSATVYDLHNRHHGIKYQFNSDEDFESVFKSYNDGSRCFYSGGVFSYINTSGEMACIDDNGNIVMCDFDQGIVGSSVNNDETKIYINMKEY